jgi:hypothetical protein
MTRPAERNGLGLSVAEAELEVLAIEAGMSLLPENERVYREWRQIVVKNGVMGVQVHDARLAAVCSRRQAYPYTERGRLQSLRRPHGPASGQCSNVNSGILQQNCARLRSNIEPDCQGIRSRGFGQ